MTYNKVGGGVGFIYNTDEHNIKNTYYIKSKKILYIQNINFAKSIYTSEIKNFVKLCNKHIWVTDSGSIYITNTPIQTEHVPALTE